MPTWLARPVSGFTNFSEPKYCQAKISPAIRIGTHLMCPRFINSDSLGGRIPAGNVFARGIAARRAFKWMLELRDVTVRHRMSRDAIAARPFVFRQMMRAEQSIEQREMDGEVHIHRFLLNPVMPMVKTRRDQQRLDRAQLPAHVGMDERGINVDQQDV